MAQINSTISEKIIKQALNACELTTEAVNLPQNTFARIRVRTQEQFLALQERGAAVQTVRVTLSNKLEQELYYVLVPWEDIIRCAVHSNSL
jgi:hypothetical protein